ncbi:hypothetical protein IAD21_01046 [Abditibacteriota bacterium]|nr:hypothetical protein IAD21_01046 [Abditibacteriota bacterium]
MDYDRDCDRFSLGVFEVMNNWSHTARKVP